MKKLAGKLCVSNETACLAGVDPRCLPSDIRELVTARCVTQEKPDVDINAFLQAWLDRFGESWVSTADLIRLGEAFWIVDRYRNERSKQTQLGHILHKRSRMPWYPNGSPDSEHRLVNRKDKLWLSNWRLEYVKEA